jgi:hypothetical protein
VQTRRKRGPRPRPAEAAARTQFSRSGSVEQPWDPTTPIYPSSDQSASPSALPRAMTRRWSEGSSNSPSHTRRCNVARNCSGLWVLLGVTSSASKGNSGKVPKTHSVGSVRDHDLGVLAITEIALKITNAVAPTDFISGAPNTAYVDW